MRKLIAKVLDGIIWLLKPKIIIVDRDTAKYMTTYCGGKPVLTKPI